MILDLRYFQKNVIVYKVMIVGVNNSKYFEIGGEGNGKPKGSY